MCLFVYENVHCFVRNPSHTNIPSVTPQELLIDSKYEHLKLEKKCCDQGCLASGILADSSLLPIVSEAKRPKTEASAPGNQSSVPLHAQTGEGRRKRPLPALHGRRAVDS